MVEKEKLIKWLKTDWLELSEHAKQWEEVDLIKEIIEEIEKGSLDAFNHKGCQKI